MSGPQLIGTATRDRRDDDDGGGAYQLEPEGPRWVPASAIPAGSLKAPGIPTDTPAIPPLQTSFSVSNPAEEQYRELCCASDMSLGNYTGDLGGAAPPAYPAFYTRVTAGTPGGRSTLHAVLDYDDDEPLPKGQAAPYPLPSTQYSSGGPYPYQGPRGPVVVKNDSVAVVPLYSYGPTLNSNGSFVHIPVLWSALSIALGLEIRGDIIRGTPCIKRHHQLFCPTAGNKYPLEDIELFIDENKALIRRMYGEFETSTEYGPPGQEVYESDRAKRRADGGGGGRGAGAGAGFSYDTRERRQAFPGNTTADDGKVDACQSKVEIVTPYWAANSAGKIRAIVNTQHFEQAIHQEVCSKVQTNRCNADCGCEQKYKWHRLLAYDPDNDCKGIFMDWFLFPSCCVCRCNPLNGGNSRSQQQSSNSRHRS